MRERLNIQVSLYAVDQSRVALLADVSSDGCRLQGMGLPGIGQDVLLVAHDLELFGHVVWKEQDVRGVKFDSPLNVSELESLRQQLAGRSDQQTSDQQAILPNGRSTGSPGNED